MINKIWTCDKCHTFKSFVGVVLIGAAVSGMLIIIRLVGEKKLQRFLNFILFFKRKDAELDLVSDF